MSIRRYSLEEDQRILETWWDADLRDQTSEELNRSKPSLNFRYYYLLKTLGIDSRQHRKNKGVLSQPLERIETHRETLSDRVEEIKSGLEALQSKFSSVEEFINSLPEGKKMENPNKGSDGIKEVLLSLYEEYKTQLERNKQIFSELENNLDDFYKMNTFERLTSISDFVPKLRSLIGKYGEEANLNIHVADQIMHAVRT